MGTEWAWLLPALCMGAFAVLATGGRALGNRGAWLAVAAIAASFALFWPIMADVVQSGAGSVSRVWFEVGDVQVRLGTSVDELAMVMLGLVTAVTLAIQVYSLGYMRGDPRFVWYFALLSLFASSMLALVLADNLLVFYVAWELVGLGSYLLIGFWYERRAAAEAAKKAFLTTRVADVALLIGILLLFKATGTFELGAIFAAAHGGEISHTTLNLAATLIFIGAMGKSAQVPFHVWLPDAMEGPTPVSALIHAATMVAAGVYLVARMLPLFEATPGVQVLIATIGLTTAFVGALLALVQNDIKKVLAYSTISQLGFMMLALGSFGYAAAVFHLLTHAFFKALLFLGAGSVIKALHEQQDIRAMGGLARRMPGTYVTFLVATFALVGLFPLSGFFSKDEVLVAALDGRGAAWYGAALVAVALTALYMARLLFSVFAGQPRSQAAREAQEPPWVMGLPMVFLMAPAAGLGLLALSFGDFGGFGSLLFLPAEGARVFELRPWVFWPALGLSYAVFFGGHWLFSRSGGEVPASPLERLSPVGYRLLENKLYIDHAYQWAVDRVVLAFSAVVALFDRRVVNDAGVDGPGRITVLGARLLRYHETGFVSSYVLAIAASAVVIVLVVVATAK